MIEWALLEPQGVISTDFSKDWTGNEIEVRFNAIFGPSSRLVFRLRGMLFAFIFDEVHNGGGDLTISVKMP